jgi:fucose permease
LALGFAFRRDGVEAFGASKEIATSTDHPKDSDDEGDNASINTSKPMKATPLAFRIKLITICGLFYFCYIGVEACFSNWIIAYTLRVRHFPPNLAPFSSSLFWIGMSIGRLTLGPLTERLGVSKALTMYLLLSILCQLIFKFFTKHSPALSLLLLALNGYVLAPTYPSGIVLLAKNMHMHEAVGAVSAAASLGQIGGAAVPLGIGFMADRIGLGKLLDVVLGLSGAVLIIWWVFDRVVGR